MYTNSKVAELFDKLLLNKDTEVDLKIPREKQEYSLKRVIKWMNQQVLPTLFLLRESIGIDKIDDMIGTANNRLKPEQRAVLDKYKKEKAAYDEWWNKIQELDRKRNAAV